MLASICGTTKSCGPNRQAGRLRVASSSAARSRIRSSSVIACHRVARRWPLRRTRPAVSSSRSIPRTRSRSAFAWAASSDVVSPPLPVPDNSDSSRSPAKAFPARFAFRREAFGGARRDRRDRSPAAGTEACVLEFAAIRVWRDVREAEVSRCVALRAARRGEPASLAFSAARAVSNVFISLRSSRRRVSIESTISWTVRMLLMLRSPTATPR